MALEGYNSESFSQKEVLAEAINQFEGEATKVAADTIQNLNETQLTNFIEKSFKNNEGERETYKDMKSNTFYPFMVQAAIDLLSDKLTKDGNENKYNENGEIDENGKTLDEHIKATGGIDNSYGPGTRKIVKLVQKILGIHEDGLAGPQFFAKTCSVLKGETNVSNFKVKGFNNDKPYSYGFEGGDNGPFTGWTKTDRTGNNNVIYEISDLGNLVNKEEFPENSCVEYEDYRFYSNGRIFKGLNTDTEERGNWKINNGKVEVVRDTDKNNTHILTPNNTVKEGGDNTVEEGKDTIKLWDGLYEVNIPKMDHLKLEYQSDKDRYVVNYRGMYLGYINMNNGVAKFETTKNGNITGEINNGTNPRTIEIKFPEKKTIDYYGNTFVLDYGLGAHLPNNGSSSLNFSNEFGSYCGWVSMNSDGSVPSKNEHGTAEYPRDLVITKDKNDSHKYYVNYKV